MPRALRIFAWVLGSCAALAVLLIAAVMVAGNTAAGRTMIERVTYRLTAGHVELIGLGGSFPADLTLSELRLIDRGGVWLSAERISLRWSPFALLERRIAVDDLKVARLDMERVPLTEAPSSGPVSVPHIDVAQFSIDVLQLGAALAGRRATLSMRGSGRMHSLEDASADVVARRMDGDGEYTLHFKFDRTRMDGTLALHEPASGPLENILQVPGLGALSANVSILGPRNAERIKLDLRAGDLVARVDGSLDWRAASADLNYSLEAPALSPRPDVSWQRLALEGRWQGTFTDPTADGHLQVDKVKLPGGIEIASMGADLTAAAGNLSMRSMVEGLRIPGSQPALFAKDPLKIEASMRVKEATRPLTVTATHRLLTLKADAITAGRPSITLDLKLPDVAPFAAFGGQNVRGAAALKAQIDRRSSDWRFAVDADAGITGGTAPWIGIAGNRVALKATGALSDGAFDVERVQLAGRAWTLSGSASAARVGPDAGENADPIKDIKARWELKVSDLGIVAPELAGTLQASGQFSGALTALTSDAALKSTLSIRGSEPGTITAELHARGLPSAPNATMKIAGTIDGSPLELAGSLERAPRTGLRASLKHAFWKSAHADGEMTMQSGIADSFGQIRFQVGQLNDFDHLIGTHLKGNLDGKLSFTPQRGRTHAQFQLDGANLTIAGLSGTLHLTGEGVTDAVAMQLHLQSPNFAGSAASLSAKANLNLDGHELRLASAAFDYRDQQLKLLSPSRLSYGNGLSIDQLKLGVLDAVLQLEGDLSPNLDLRASLQHVTPQLINVFLPDAVSEGTIDGQARLQGTIAAPTGSITLNARGLRSASDEALGLPPLDATAQAKLAGDSTSIDVRLSAGSDSLLTVTGTAPLNADGAFDLKMLGKLDIGVVNPVFEARGIHAGGRLAADATLGGKIGDPQIRGTITLSQGTLRDYVRGINLTNINAEVSGSEGTLQIKNFGATAASGTLVMTGSIGVLQPGIPVHLTIAAKNAQLLTSNIVTANINADIRVTGTAKEKLGVSGSIHVNRALVGIPDSLPPNVAVLDVRRRGKPPPVPEKVLEIDLDVSIQASGQILVQGRGLDAELGGDLHVGGTSDAPVVSGGFDLQRGTFTIASTKLVFSTGSTGRVSFDGAGLKKRNIDPTLDFTAQSTVGSVTAQLRITGYADSPKFEFTSVPPGTPQDEIMSLLLFGEPAAQLTALQAAQIGAALASLSGVGGSGGNPLTKVQRNLGLDRLSVGAGTTTSATGAPENSGAAILAGRYISKRVYVEGKQSTTGQSQVEVDVDLTKHLKVQSRLGNGTAIQGTTPENDPGSSIGLSYQFEY
jgi:translocation and assembly module TamB